MLFSAFALYSVYYCCHIRESYLPFFNNKTRELLLLLPIVYFLYQFCVEPPCATVSRKRPLFQINTKFLPVKLLQQNTSRKRSPFVRDRDRDRDHFQWWWFVSFSYISMSQVQNKDANSVPCIKTLSNDPHKKDSAERQCTRFFG